jgi:hypothetical protein
MTERFADKAPRGLCTPDPEVHAILDAVHEAPALLEELKRKGRFEGDADYLKAAEVIEGLLAGVSRHLSPSRMAMIMDEAGLEKLKSLDKVIEANLMFPRRDEEPLRGRFGL